MSEQLLEHSKTSLDADTKNDLRQSGIVCFHGAESHSGWFANLSDAALKSGQWQHVITSDRSGWRGDVRSIDAAHEWIESSINAARRKMLAAGDCSAIDLVASSWGALALLNWWVGTEPGKFQYIRSVHLIAPGIFISNGLKRRIGRGVVRDALLGGGLFSGKISLELGIQDFIAEQDRFVEPTKFIEQDQFANHHISLSFIRTSNQMRRNILRAFSVHGHKFAEDFKPPLTIHLPSSDNIIDLSKTREFAVQSGIRLHHHDVHGHALVLMQPAQIIDVMKQCQSCQTVRGCGLDRDLMTVEVFEKQNPFWFTVRHSHGSRTANESYVLRVTGIGFDKRLISGFGEALPRSYLTGETIDTFRAQIQPVFESIATPIFDVIQKSRGDVERTAEALIAGWHEASAAGCLALWSGIDLAIIDWWSKATGLPVVTLMRHVRAVLSGESHNFDLDLLNAREMNDKTLISMRATIPMVSIWMTKFLTRIFLWFGYRSLKVKVGDEKSIERILAVGAVCHSELQRGAIEITLDGNQGFAFDRAVAFSNELKARAPQLWARITAFEDPVECSDAKRLSDFSNHVSLATMADEKLYSGVDLKDFASFQGIKYWNLRIGKCGGLTGAVIVASRGASQGINLVVGALVGEDLVMQKAADIVCEIFPIAWREESFSKFLLKTSSFVCSEAQSRAQDLCPTGFGVALAQKSFFSTVKRFKFFAQP